ncbi:hypothetical protein VTO58DRAFT_108561 [Aureobasidium pullulans]
MKREDLRQSEELKEWTRRFSQLLWNVESCNNAVLYATARRFSGRELTKWHLRQKRTPRVSSVERELASLLPFHLQLSTLQHFLSHSHAPCIKLFHIQHSRPAPPRESHQQ